MKTTTTTAAPAAPAYGLAVLTRRAKQAQQHQEAIQAARPKTRKEKEDAEYDAQWRQTHPTPVLRPTATAAPEGWVVAEQATPRSGVWALIQTPEVRWLVGLRPEGSDAVWMGSAAWAPDAARTHDDPDEAIADWATRNAPMTHDLIGGE